MTVGPWFIATGQRGKLLVSLTLLGIAVVLGLLMLRPGLDPTADLAAVIAWVLWLLVMSTAFRCPACGTRTGWWYLRHASVTVWFTAFLTATECPKCGDQGLVGRHQA